METIANFFIATAHAQQPAPEGGGLMGLIFPIILLVVFYLFLIRPQQKKAKEHREMVANLQKGDEVVTAGGLLGRITEVGENFIMMEVADNVAVKVQRPNVAAVMPKGTVKGDL